MHIVDIFFHFYYAFYFENPIKSKTKKNETIQQKKKKLFFIIDIFICYYI